MKKRTIVALIIAACLLGGCTSWMSLFSGSSDIEDLSACVRYIDGMAKKNETKSIEKFIGTWEKRKEGVE